MDDKADKSHVDQRKAVGWQNERIGYQDIGKPIRNSRLNVTAEWQSGYAAACKAVDLGSTPGSASIIFNKTLALTLHSRAKYMAAI